MQKVFNLNTFEMVAEATKNVRRSMARKGKEADVQVFVKTEEEWDKLLEPQVNTSHCNENIRELRLSLTIRPPLSIVCAGHPHCGGRVL